MHLKRGHKPPSSIRNSPKDLISSLPDSPGVYLMFGSAGELLYIGKSKSIRSRVRAHFASAEERRLCRQVVRVDARETAGELGALLLESELIKQLKPIYNKRLRRQRRLLVARKVVSPQGYFRVVLEAVSSLEATKTLPILALFRTKTQAREYLASIAKSHRLCPALLGLERTNRYCFAYHLHQCSGACMGEEDAHSYNARLEDAFEARRIQAWPFEGAVLIEEKSADGREVEVFVVDHWCLLYSFTYSEKTLALRVKGSHHFDFDSYRILASYVFCEENRQHMRELSKEELAMLVSKLKAA